MKNSRVASNNLSHSCCLAVSFTFSVKFLIVENERKWETMMVDFGRFWRNLVYEYLFNS